MNTPLTELVTVFKAETNQSFQFLVDEHGFSNDSGLSDFSQPVSCLKNWNGETLPGIFWFIRRFSRSDMRFEIAYGDRELYVEGHWWFDESDQGFGLWEILLAADRYERNISGSAWVNSAEYMRKTISEMAGSLKENIDLFLNPGRQTIDRALKLRGDRLRYDKEQQRLKDLNRARVIAADAFRSKNYQRVIELLTPFEEVLSVADKKKIKLSEKYAKNL